MQDFCKNNKVLFDIAIQPTEAEHILEVLTIEGLNIQGGEEEKPGLKSFDEYDALLDALE